MKTGEMKQSVTTNNTENMEKTMRKKKLVIVLNAKQKDFIGQVNQMANTDAIRELVAYAIRQDQSSFPIEDLDDH